MNVSRVPHFLLSARIVIHAAYSAAASNNAIVIFDDLIQAASSLPIDPSALESSISVLERAISALESDIEALERLSVSWEFWVWPFTFMIVVGVVAEFWLIRHDWREDNKTWALAHFGLFRTPGRPSVKKLMVEYSSVGLIALGVAGQLLVGIKVASIDGHIRSKSVVLRSKDSDLRSKSEQLVALVTKQSGDAATSATTSQN